MGDGFLSKPAAKELAPGQAESGRTRFKRCDDVIRDVRTITSVTGNTALISNGSVHFPRRHREMRPEDKVPPYTVRAGSDDLVAAPGGRGPARVRQAPECWV